MNLRDGESLRTFNIYSHAVVQIILPSTHVVVSIAMPHMATTLPSAAMKVTLVIIAVLVPVVAKSVNRTVCPFADVICEGGAVSRDFTENAVTVLFTVAPVAFVEEPISVTLHVKKSKRKSDLSSLRVKMRRISEIVLLSLLGGCA